MYYKGAISKCPHGEHCVLHLETLAPAPRLIVETVRSSGACANGLEASTNALGVVASSSGASWWAVDTRCRRLGAPERRLGRPIRSSATRSSGLEVPVRPGGDEVQRFGSGAEPFGKRGRNSSSRVNASGRSREGRVTRSRGLEVGESYSRSPERRSAVMRDAAAPRGLA